MSSTPLNNLSFKVKTSLLVILLFSLTVITAIRYQLLVDEISKLNISQSTEIMLTGHKNDIRNITDMMAITLAAAAKNSASEDETQKVFKTLIQDARFLPDESGYMFIYKKGGTVFAHATKPELEGKNIINFKDANGKLLIKELDEAASQGGAFVDFLWDKPGQGVTPKLGYARMIPGGKYWIGTGIYIDDIEAQEEAIERTQKELTSSALKTLYILLGVLVFCFAIPLTILLISSLVKPINELTEAADGFSRGKMDIVIPHTDRSDEIGKLANALKRLGMSVKVAMAAMKKK
jgi:methyl-accepting chemotaxis protein